MTSFPTSIKTFSNPTSTSAQSSPSHSQQHIDANNEINAIETALGANLANVLLSSNLDTDNTLAANSDTKISSQKAVKSYIDTQISEATGLSVPIPDSDLQQITTASKVSGTSLTGLANIPEAAGVIPAANLPSSTGYTDIGDAAAFYKRTGDFTKDDSWHDLDLSSIVPSGTKAVLLSVIIKNTAAEKTVKFRENGNSNDIVVGTVTSQVANITLCSDIIVSVDANRVIEYYAVNSTWTVLDVIVKGYWK